MGSRLPEGVEVRALEESADTIYLVLPLRSADLQTGELSDEALEEVAGGGSWATACQDTSCPGLC